MTTSVGKAMLGMVNSEAQINAALLIAEKGNLTLFK